VHSASSSGIFGLCPDRPAKAKATDPLWTALTVALPDLQEALLPSAWHHAEQHANNPIEADQVPSVLRRRSVKRQVGLDSRQPTVLPVEVMLTPLLLVGVALISPDSGRVGARQEGCRSR
jgi:hypothetical protein